MDGHVGRGGQCSTEEVLLSINELCRLKEHLQNQLDACSLRKSVSDDQSTPSDVSRELLVQKVEETKKQVIKLKSISKLRDLATKALLYSTESYRSMYPSHFPPHEEDKAFSTSQTWIIRSKLFELHALNKEILTLRSQKIKLKQRSLELDKEIEEIALKNRESLQLLKHKLSTNEESLTEEGRQDLENDMKQVKCIKHIFQCLIQASRVDWSEDDDLRQLVFRLGR